MKPDVNNDGFSQMFQLMTLITYTILSVITVTEDILLSWEKWPIILIVIGVIAAWAIHIQMRLSYSLRMWIYNILIMGTFFFYGIHIQSIFDISIIGVGIVIICALTGIKRLVTFCQITYYITIIYNVAISIYQSGAMDVNFYLRLFLHVMVVTAMAQVGRRVIERWNQEIAKTRDEIEGLNESTMRLDDFLAGTSHELRTPVGAIMGISELWIEKTTDDKMKADLTLIKDAGGRIADQISDILDYSELDRNKLVVTCENYMISSLLGDLVAALKPYLTTNVELVLDIDPAIPSVMYSDVNKIKKILWHLIMNALKYTVDGGVYVHITSEEQEYGVNLCIDIIDTGIGMSEEELHHVKERFYQSDGGMTKSRRGLGLGLPIVDGFVKALGGFMLMESEVNEGTRVHLCIPQQVVDGASCMSINNPERVSLGAYFHFDKYSVAEVGDFYSSMITNVVKGMGVMVHGVDSIEELKKVVESTYISHLFLGMHEYESDPEYIESLTSKFMVFLTADSGYPLPADSHIRFFEKPLYCFPIISAINSGYAYEANDEQMICKGIRALVVDDEPLNLKVATKLFGQYEMVVTTATSGYMAIDMCEEQKFDIIFMDYMMPGIDGVETVKRIRENIGSGGNMPLIVAMTANVVSTARDMFKREGFDGFVSKPVNINEFERVLKNILPPSRISYVRKEAYKEKVLDNSVKESVISHKQSISTEESVICNKESVSTNGQIIHDKESVEANERVMHDKELASSDKQQIHDKEDNLIKEQEVLNTETDRKDEVEDDGLYDILKKLGVDVTAGLEYYGNNEEIYQEIIRDFAVEVKTSVPKLKYYFLDRDSELYEIKIHALKGLLKMIGAYHMADIAYELEQAAGDGITDDMEAAHNEVLDWCIALSRRII